MLLQLYPLLCSSIIVKLFSLILNNTPLYYKITAIHAFITRVRNQIYGYGFAQSYLVKLNCLPSDVARFYSLMNNWGLALYPNCKCGATKQTADHIISQSFILASQGISGLMVLDDETKCLLNTLAVNI